MAETRDKAVAVAVKKSKYSQLALKWAVENLAKETQSLSLLHITPKSDTFGHADRVQNKYRQLELHCGKEVTRGMDQSYKETKEMHAKEMFSPLILYCQRKNVQYEEVIVEDDDVVKGVADFVLKNNIDVLVVGSGSRSGIFRRLRCPDTAGKIAKNAPYFCTVFTVGKGGSVSAKLSSTSAQDISTRNSVRNQEPEIGNHVRSIDSIAEPRISVSAGDSLMHHRQVNEFEFRSPLRINVDSDFSWEGGQPPPDSDISFISSDKKFYYDHSGPLTPRITPSIRW